MNNVLLSLENVRKRFEANTVLNGISLQVLSGEIFFLLGPSGCGKTTLLRVIAGFCQPDAGRVILDGEDITFRPAWERHIGLVFQNYALWPHLTVWENVAYGLKLRRLPGKFIQERVEEMLKITKLSPQKNLYPPQLSGGQQQRVALARSLIVRPRLLLLDEPLSNLDAKFREEMRQEIKNIQKATGVTMVYVTHDQREALTMAHRLAVMNTGEISQIGSPWHLYFSPENRFVADFVGVMNFLPGRVFAIRAGDIQVETPEGLLVAEVSRNFTVAQPVEVAFRPESVSFRPGQVNIFRATIAETEMGEGVIKVTALTPGGHRLFVNCSLEYGRRLEWGDQIVFSVPPNRVLVFPG
ncbi:MAG: ABC transporter ATP-binding protein [Candidatus Omnitrophica bacterium]|nr:ABC transporter ATP-binding protein [Candidatus Omnitrophota bacterium]